ncbi:hypothetical protein [Halodesulfovibrio marinisediminis]|uniref:Uncharacterized protein n=1 Tax=Halodesulfovibrio marinisediminis DSM 17456 TaxID=1121457 RepID=A0A1N6J9K0_9BACT|nr:hypothetical protein [Halodesulfovibrio marinisediminis]SIO41044.1 hypothetical protein SAMN02745161_3265 [Halodesulfovibrio marinisediminis DSM 17456]
MGILRKLWRGELPLYVAFWFFGVILGIIIILCVNEFTFEAKDVPTSFRLGWLLLALLYTGFMCIALWRSADKYKGHPIWSISVRFYSAILFMTFISFVVTTIQIIINT